MITSNAYKHGYETGWYGHKSMSKADYTAGRKQDEERWKDYLRGLRDGKEDRRDGYRYNHGEEAGA